MRQGYVTTALSLLSPSCVLFPLPPDGSEIMPCLSCEKQHSQATLLILSDHPGNAVSQPLPSCHHFPCLIFRELGDLNWSISKDSQSSYARSSEAHVDGINMQTQSSSSPMDAYNVFVTTPSLPKLFNTDLTHSLKCWDSYSLTKQMEFLPLTNTPGNKNKTILAHKTGFQPSFDLWSQPFPRSST